MTALGHARSARTRAQGGLAASVTWWALAALLAPASVDAQAPAPVPTLAPDSPLTLRPTPPSRRLAGRVLRNLALRLDVPVALGEDAPPAVLEAVPSGHAAIALEDGEVRLVLGGPQAQVFHTLVDVGGLRPAAAARAVALALEALRDMALDGPPPGRAYRRTVTLRGGREVTWVYLEPRDGFFGPRRRVEANAKPLIQIGFLGGISTERLTAQLAPRVGIGLCQSEWCFLLEGDLPLVPESTDACDGRTIEYRPVTLGMRLLLRPFVFGDVSFAFGIGILMRFGLANLVGVDASRLTTNLGLRGTVEAAWRVAGPFEIVFDVGVDAHTSPARLTRIPRPRSGELGCPLGTPENLLVEDIIGVQGVLAIRLRP